jgi:2-polyprenyl-3-methyl-5-hydroxy-6-metoxy-1,4-benzoquinol methylase
MSDINNVCYLCNGNVDLIPEFLWLVKCDSCGLIYNPALSIDAHEVSDRFYDDVNMEHRRKMQMILQRIARVRWQWLEKRLPKSEGYLLEIGGGTGEFLLPPKQAGWMVHGLELSESFRDAAREWYDLELQGDQLAQAGLPAESVDVVALLHVFEHLPNPIEFLREISQVLKPGGFLFIVVPNVNSWTDALFGKASPTLIKMDHFFHYDPDTLKKMVSQSDFEAIEIDTFEPAHHLWTSLYGFLSNHGRNPAKMASAATSSVKASSFIGKIKTNLPYWAGSMTSIFLFPLRLWLRKINRGHEIYLLARRRP